MASAMSQWWIHLPEWEGADYGERAEREPITEVWGQSPQRERGPGAEPLVEVREGETP